MNNKFYKGGSNSPFISNEYNINTKNGNEIITLLNSLIIGQENPKLELATSIVNFFMRIKNPDGDYPNPNIHYIGNTGTGKTLLVKTLEKHFQEYFIYTNMTGKSPASYKGAAFLGDLDYQIRAKTKSLVPSLIVFIDEIDKTSRIGPDSGRSSEGLQNELTGITGEEGRIVSLLEGDKYAPIDTSDMLFIAAGAYHGFDKESSLEGIISKRLGDTPEGNILEYVTPEDLYVYGLKRELIGRFPVIVPFHPLSVEDKTKILQLENSVLYKNINLLKDVSGYEVEIEKEVLELLAENATPKTGARGLDASCRKLFKGPLIYPEKYVKDGKIVIGCADAINLFKK